MLAYIHNPTKGENHYLTQHFKWWQAVNLSRFEAAITWQQSVEQHDELSWVTSTPQQQCLCLREGPHGQADEGGLLLDR